MSRLWFIYQDDMQKGPFTDDEVIHYIQSSGIKAEDHAWTEGMAEWVRIDQIGDFYSVLHDEPPGQDDYYEEQAFAESEPPSTPEVKEPAAKKEPQVEAELTPEPMPIPKKEYTTSSQSTADKTPADHSLPLSTPAKDHSKAGEPVAASVKKSSKTKLPIISSALAVVLIGGGLLVHNLISDRPEITAGEIVEEAPGEEGETAAKQPQEPRGNTPGNINQGGFVAASDGWVYFSMPNDERLIRMRSDGTEKQLLVEEDASSITGIQYINVIGDWLYFTSGSDIVKVQTDGSERTVIEPQAGAMYLNVVGDWIYYSAGRQGLYKIRVDGEDKTKIHDDRAYDINVIGDWIYFSNRDDDWQPYKVRIDGSESGRLLDTEVLELLYYNEALYFTTDNLTISRVSVDGGSSLEIDEHPVTSGFIIDDDWIYHLIRVDMSRNFSLLRMDPESGETEIIQELELFDESERGTIIINFNIVDGWVYIYGKALDDDFEAVDEAIFRVRTDGSGLERVIDPETEIESAAHTGEEQAGGNDYLVDVPALLGLDFDDALAVLDQHFSDPPTVEGPKEYMEAEITIYAYVDIIEDSLVAFSIGLGKIEGLEGVDYPPVHVTMGTIEGIPMDYDLEDLYRFSNIDPNAAGYSLEDVEITDNLIEFTVRPNS